MAEQAIIQTLHDHDTGKAIAPRTVVEAISGKGNKWNYLGFTEDDQVGVIEGTWPCNKNLLINSDFRNPVNQRGETVYTWQVGNGHSYFIDGWFRTRGIVKLTDEGFTYNVVSGQASAWLGQTIENYGSLDKTATISILLSDNTLLSATGNTTVRFGTEHGGATYCVQYEPRGHASSATFEIWRDDATTETDVSVVAAKMELGNIQTLAHKEGDTWVLNEMPNYAEELLKCQRYQVVLGGVHTHSVFGIGFNNTAVQARVLSSLGVPLRAAPTISTVGTFELTSIEDNTLKDVTNITFGSITQNAVFLLVESSGLQTGSLVTLRPKNGDTTAKIILDANL